jgi:hypothetical protein
MNLLLTNVHEYIGQEVAPWITALRANQGTEILCSDDLRLPEMPEKPTLLDYFQLRFGLTQHLLQRARLAMQNGCSEKSCLHGIFVRMSDDDTSHAARLSR